MEKWDWVELRYMNLFGWWPSSCKTEKAHNVFKTYGMILYTIAIVLLVFELVGLYEEIAKGSLSGCLLNMTTTLLGIQCCVRMTLFNVCRGRIKRIVNQIEELNQNVCTVLDDEKVKEIAAPSLFLCRFFRLYLLVGLTSTLQWIASPLLARMQGKQAFIIETMFVWPTDTLPWWTFTYFIQLVHVCCAIGPHFITDSLFWGFLTMVYMQFDFLKYVIANIDYSNDDGKENNKNASIKVNKNTAMNYCFKQYEGILILHDEINTLIGYPLLLLHVCSTIAICVCIFRFTKQDTDILQAYSLLEIVGIQMFMVFIHCVLCQRVEDQDVDITRAAYDSNWYEGNLSDKKSLVILMEGVKRKRSFGAIINSNLQAYIALLQTSFSYYNFLIAMTEMQ